MVTINPNPIAVYAGDNLVVTPIRVRNSDNSLFDFDAEGWTNWRAQWRNRDESVTVDFIVDYVNPGEFWLSLTPEDTRAMNGPGSWDLQADLDGVITTWLRGTTTWRNDVTR